ncbi:hypothetical protein GCM10027449_29820 [Sinomonas notoginsengisoli]|uniref:PHP domain-containing protein n=1 Tax=Sinomonas notoginsengisoli TaxID=1457311 RepID=UPI001F42FAA6|nr:PHP domain-containing protein [Sinomonas notoginsengisoli]
MPFTHLHVASAFSPQYGVSWPDEIAAAALADRATAFACTDRDGLYGAVHHVRACRTQGLDPIIGVDLTVLAELDGILAPDLGGTAAHDGATAHHGAQRLWRGSAGVAGRVVVLAHGSNRGAGWGALCRLVSDAHAHARTGRGSDSSVPVGVLRSELAARCLDPETGRPVLTVLLGPYSDVGRALGGRRFLRPRTLFREWVDAMPAGVLAIELATHLAPQGEPMSTGHAVRMLRLATEHGVPAVLTNAVHSVTEQGAGAAAHGWLKPSPLMQRLAREIICGAGLSGTDLANLLANTERIADRCRLDTAGDLGWMKPVFPEASVLGIAGPSQRELAERARAGIPRRFPALAGQTAREVEARLDQEISVIDARGLAGCFLTVAEATEVIRGLGVRSAVRGRGASSLVNYLLGISHIDPLHLRLPFEDFLAASGLPVFGLDVESAHCSGVYRRISERFGAGRVALARTTDGAPSHGAESALGLALPLEDDEPDGVVRPGGLVLGDARLLDRTPVEPSSMGLPGSQFGRDDLGSLGLLTIDVVGVPLQSVMAFAVREVARIDGTGVDLDSLPLDRGPVPEQVGAGVDGGPSGCDPAAAFVAHQSAWLKARHPEAYLAGSLEHNSGGPSGRLLSPRQGAGAFRSSRWTSI